MHVHPHGQGSLMWYASQYGEGRHLRQISFFWFYCFAYFARDFVRSNLSAFVRSSPCTMPNIGGGVERTSAEPRLRRPGRRITFLECSRRLWHGYSWGVEAYLRAAPPHCSRDTLNNNHQYTFRGSTDHHPSPCVLRSRGLAVPLLRPLQCAFYVVAIRGNDHR